MEKTLISVDDASALPFSPAVRCGDLLFISGQLPIDEAGQMPDSVEEQTAVVMRNIGALLRAAGADYSNLVKTSVFLTDFSQFAAMNAAYCAFLPPGVKPARAAMEVTALAKGAKVEIEAIAML